jgi:hypothetical protein
MSDTDPEHGSKVLCWSPSGLWKRRPLELSKDRINLNPIPIGELFSLAGHFREKDVRGIG